MWLNDQTVTASWWTGFGRAAFQEKKRESICEMKQIAPSDQLRKWFAHDAKRWTEFQKRYRDELRAKAALTEQLRELEKRHHTVTLIYSARDDRHNQAVALGAVLQRCGGGGSYDRS
jgi:uncharacterized protein YeaO (DUF488 family)